MRSASARARARSGSNAARKVSPSLLGRMVPSLALNHARMLNTGAPLHWPRVTRISSRALRRSSARNIVADYAPVFSAVELGIKNVARPPADCTEYAINHILPIGVDGHGFQCLARFGHIR